MLARRAVRAIASRSASQPRWLRAPSKTGANLLSPARSFAQPPGGYGTTSHPNTRLSQLSPVRLYSTHRPWSSRLHESRAFRHGRLFGLGFLSLRFWVTFIQVFLWWHLLSHHIGEVRLSGGASMLPTLWYEGDWLLVVRLPVLNAWRSVKSIFTGKTNDGDDEDTHIGAASKYNVSSSKYDRLFGMPLALGDVVVALSPTHPEKHVCKRIVGLPGDRILIDPRSTEPSAPAVKASAGDDDVAKESGSLDQVISPDSPVGAVEHGELYITVPPGHVFLAGDNMANSTDSRHYGPVPLGLIQGKMLARVWPVPTWLNRGAVTMLPMAPRQQQSAAAA